MCVGFVGGEVMLELLCGVFCLSVRSPKVHMAENDVVKRNRKTIHGLSDYQHVDQGSPGSGTG